MEESLFKNHNIILEDRKKFVLTGVKEVISFDDETVMLDTALGKLTIKGATLRIINFEAMSGDLSGEGKIHAIIYTAPESSTGFFSKIFR